jgi:sugar lactone lactonase YvrE
MKKLHFLCMALAAVIIVGCAAPERKEESKVFYPEPPELPRIQFLASFTGSQDIQSKQSAFDVFLTGKEGGSVLQKPYGVAVYDGKIYVCDTMQGVRIFDFEKKTFGGLQGAHGLGNLLQPINISVDKDGNKYITDPARGQVLMFDKNDFFVRAFGTPGVWRPVDAAAFEDRVYVVDVKNAEIRVFDRETGDLLKKFGQKGEPKDILVLPTNIAFDHDGYLYVSDSGRFQVVEFDRDGHERATIGELGSEPTKFARPKGVALDRNGNLYVADAAFDSIQVFNKDHRLLLFFGKGGTGPGDLELPAKVAINYDSVKYFTKYADPGFEIEYIIAVTSQLGDHMVNVYGFGKEKGKKYPTDEELAKQLQEKWEALQKEKDEKTKDEEEKSREIKKTY